MDAAVPQAGRSGWLVVGVPAKLSNAGAVRAVAARRGCCGCFRSPPNAYRAKFSLWKSSAECTRPAAAAAAGVFDRGVMLVAGRHAAAEEEGRAA